MKSNIWRKFVDLLEGMAGILIFFVFIPFVLLGFGLAMLIKPESFAKIENVQMIGLICTVLGVLLAIFYGWIIKVIWSWFFGHEATSAREVENHALYDRKEYSEEHALKRQSLMEELLEEDKA